MAAVRRHRRTHNLGKALRDRRYSQLGPFHIARLVVRLTTVIVALHVLEILLWASCYRWFCFPSWESAVYFSATTYSTVGDGDVTLPLKWRKLGPVESITGVLTQLNSTAVNVLLSTIRHRSYDASAFTGTLVTC